MRDMLIVLVIVNSLPVILFRPYIGVLLWCWISYMNPHRLAWGFAYSMPLGMMIGLTTIIAFVFSRDPKRLPRHPATVLLILLTIWISVTTVFAIAPEAAYGKWDRSMKILLMTFVTLILINNRERLHAMVWIIVVSLGFYGFKGGIFTVLTGGDFRVWGPSESFIADNNTLALALIMIVPLMRYLSLHSDPQWLRLGLNAAIPVTCVAVIGSHSRGALVAGIAMLLYLLAKSRQRLLIGLAGLFVVAFAVMVAPQHWVDRMESIRNYEQDPSAQGRLQAWTYGYKLALERPVVGGGFLSNADKARYFKHVPEAETTRAYHSVYFEMLGDHGFTGLGIFLSLLLATFVCAGTIIRQAKNAAPNLRWAADLAAMSQVSLVGYMVGGLFLNLAFYDLFYHIVAMLLITKTIVDREVSSEEAVAEAPPEPRPSGLSVASRATMAAREPASRRPAQ